MISSLLSASGPALFVAVLAWTQAAKPDREPRMYTGGIHALDLPATYPPEVTR